MQRLALAACVLAVGFAASCPARADFAIVRFTDGRCQVWWDSADNPWGAGWAKIAIGLPDSNAAQAVLNNAIARHLCR